MYKKCKMQVNDSHPKFEIVSIVSINYTTESKTSYFYNKLKASFGETDLQDTVPCHWSLCFLVSPCYLQDAMPCQWSSSEMQVLQI